MNQAHSAPHATQYQARLPEPEEIHEDHGHSTAAWTGVTLMIIGSIVWTLGIVLSRDLITWIGVALTVIGALAWPVLIKMGFGGESHRK